MGGSENGWFEVNPGGASYLEFVPAATGQSRVSLTLEVEEKSLPPAEFRFVLVTWPVAGGKPADTPVRWIRPDESGPTTSTPVLSMCR
ncbi:hypothetical protein GCM10009555_042480 [Acrocarpospora macrocephala]|uniref:Uncharacterized protein n=1 Tax=Acrocarpospora macrocephala TaxID=150177 RepID=A0A5M3X243_9ACTN|nr:hypothetical protein Amac_072680 [Acrocarpospora macrocephala]